VKKTTKILLRILLACLLLGAAGWGGWIWYDNNIDRSGWREQDGTTMYADFHGKPVTGWLELEGERYYFDESGSLQTGWLSLENGTYFLDSRGRMQTHWLDTEEGRFRLGDDGILATYWQEIDGKRYFFGEDGRMVTGWQELDGTRRYFHPDGALASGWLELDGNIWYLDSTGSPLTAWQEIDGNTYWFDGQGLLATGWVEIYQQTYNLGENGALVTGWTETEDGTYYFLPQGPRASGWQEIDGNRYFFGEEGRMHTGWLEQGEYLYYLHPDGTAAAGPTEIDGEIHYFTPKGIRVLLVNRRNPLSADYEIDLVEIESGWMVDRLALEPLKAMLEAMREEGLLPYFSSTYRNYATQQAVWASYVQSYLEAGYDEAQANAMTASYVAVPGTSEHHTGLAMDIVGHDYFYSGHPGSTMAVQAWLAEHCWEYGFILRYTAEKSAITGFAPETWHFRYVGTEVSLDMKDSGLCLEEYLGAA